MNFLVISIPTFNRCEKLNCLLNSFLREINNSIYKTEIGLFVSNNGSTDNTSDVLLSQKRNFEKAGIPFACHSESKNKGMDFNYFNMINLPCAQYLWFFSDDDILFENKLDGLILSIKKYRPSVCNFSFLQEPYTRKKFKYINMEERLYKNIVDYPILVSTKLSACIISTNHLCKYNFKKIYNDGSLWAYVPYVFSNLLEDNKLLIYPKLVAGSDGEFLNIRYDPIVYTKLYDIIRLTYCSYGKENSFLKSGFIKPVPLCTDFNFFIMNIQGRVELEGYILTRLKKRIFKYFLRFDSYIKPGFYKCLIKLLLALVKIY